MRMNKKGQWSWQVILLILLVVVGLMFLFFNTKIFRNTSDAVDPNVGSNNFASVINNCNLQCETNDPNYCNDPKVVRLSSSITVKEADESGQATDETVAISRFSATCAQLNSESFVADGLYIEKKQHGVGLNRCARSCPFVQA